MPLVEQRRLIGRVATWLRPGGWLLATTGHEAWTGTEQTRLGGTSTIRLWSSLWPDRPDDQIRFDLNATGDGCSLRWTLFTPGPRPTESKLGHMRFRLNVLINERLRLSYGQ
jgi:hypothetical protein